MFFPQRKWNLRGKVYKYGCIISFHYLVLQTKAMYQTCPKYFHFMKIDDVKGKKMQIKNKAQTRSIYFLILIWSLWYDFVLFWSMLICNSLFYFIWVLTAFEADFMPFVSTSKFFFGGIYSSVAFRAFWYFRGFKWHCHNLQRWKEMHFSIMGKNIRSSFCTKERQ